MTLPTVPEEGTATQDDDRVTAVAPLTEVIMLIWEAVLGRDDLDAGTDFFTAGGHSLLALKVLARIRASVRVDLSVRVLFEARTPLALATAVDERISDQDRRRILELSAGE
jgi:hypothetical protein